MKLEEFVKTLDHSKSYWLIDGYSIERLNNVPTTSENLYIVFECEPCSENRAETVYHVIPYTELKVDENGDYVVLCEGKEAAYLDTCYVLPDEIQELFDETKFESYE